MLSFTYFALSVLLISVTAQDCSKPPKGRHSECCPGSCKILTSATAAECGLPEEMVSGEAGPGGPGGRGGPGGKGPPSCEAIQCLMKKNDLLTADNKLDKEALKTFVDKEYSAEWKPAIEKAMATCDASTGKPDECEVRSSFYCLKHNLFLNCPDSVFVKSAECSALKVHMEKCPMPPPPPSKE